MSPAHEFLQKQIDRLAEELAAERKRVQKLEAQLEQALAELDQARGELQDVKTELQSVEDAYPEPPHP